MTGTSCRGKSALAAAIAIAATLVPPGSSHADDGSLERADGAVEVSRGGLAVWEPAHAGQSLGPRDALRTGPASAASLRVPGLSLAISGEAQLRLEPGDPAGQPESILLERGRFGAEMTPDESAARVHTAHCQVTAEEARLDLATSSDATVVHVRRGRAQVQGVGPNDPAPIALLEGFSMRWPDEAPFAVERLGAGSRSLPAAPDPVQASAGSRAPRAPGLRARLVPGQEGAGAIALEDETGTAIQRLSPAQILALMRGEPDVLDAATRRILRAIGVDPAHLSAQLAAML